MVVMSGSSRSRWEAEPEKKRLAKKSWSDIKNSIMKNNDKNVKSLWLNSAKIVCGGSRSQKRRRNRGEMKYGKWIECMVGKCSRNAHKFTRSRRKCSWTNFFFVASCYAQCDITISQRLLSAAACMTVVNGWEAVQRVYEYKNGTQWIAHFSSFRSI